MVALMEVREVPVSQWKLLPAPPGTCEECAVLHEPELPHNQQSLHYQYYFFFRNGRWPTWTDAMRHCSWEMKNRWCGELELRGVTPYRIYRNWGNPEWCKTMSGWGVWGYGSH